MSTHRFAIAFFILTVCVGLCFAGTCPYCGAQNPDIATFCKNCGRALRETQEPTPSAEDLHIEETRRAAHEAFEAHDWERALSLFQELLRLNPADSSATRQASRCLANMQVPETSMGIARIISDPTGAKVTVNGNYRGVTPLYSLELPTGTWPISLEKKRHEEWLGSLEIVEEGTSLIDVQLREKSKGKAFAWSLILPGQGQRYRQRPVMGWVFTAAMVGALGASAYMYADYEDAQDAYDTARASYDDAVAGHEDLWRDVEEKYRDAKDREDNLSISFSVAIGLYALNLIDSLIF